MHMAVKRPGTAERELDLSLETPQRGGEDPGRDYYSGGRVFGASADKAA